MTNLKEPVLRASVPPCPPENCEPETLLKCIAEFAQFVIERERIHKQHIEEMKKYLNWKHSEDLRTEAEPEDQTPVSTANSKTPDSDNNKPYQPPHLRHNKTPIINLEPETITEIKYTPPHLRQIVHPQKEIEMNIEIDIENEQPKNNEPHPQLNERKKIKKKEKEKARHGRMTRVTVNNLPFQPIRNIKDMFREQNYNHRLVYDIRWSFDNFLEILIDGNYCQEMFDILTKLNLKFSTDQRLFSDRRNRSFLQRAFSLTKNIHAKIFYFNIYGNLDLYS